MALKLTKHKFGRATMAIDVGPGLAAKTIAAGEALAIVVAALAGADFEDKRRILSWAAATYGIDVTKLASL